MARMLGNVRFDFLPYFRPCYTCRELGHWRKECPNKKELRCHFCFKKDGHHWRNCDTRLFWQEMCLSSPDKSEFFKLSLIDVPENSGLVLKPTQQEMHQFDAYIRKIYAEHWAEHGAFIVRPPTQLPPKLDVDLITVLKEKKVTPLDQIYTPPPSKQDGVFLVNDSGSQKKGKDMTVSEYFASCLDADKAKDGVLYSRTADRQPLPFWFAMLHHFKDVAEGREQKPQYVINLLHSLFPVDDKKMWYLPNLRRAFSPYLHNPDEIINAVNVPNMYIGQLGSFSAWHVEDLNLFSINKHHLGKPKYWLEVSYQYTEQLRELFRQQVPHYYDCCEAADWHKGIVVLPQMLLAQTPPIPFHTLKQCKWDYVVTCPSAFHFVLNGGANLAEAMNYPSEEWTYYSYPFTRCTCAHKAGYTAIERLFKRV